MRKRREPVLPAVEQEMFDLAPVSLWLEDYSALRTLFVAWRAAGVTDLRDYLREDPRRVQHCAASLRVLRVNRKTLALFAARDLAHLVANLDSVFRDDMRDRHIDELVALWDGETAFPARP